MKSMLFKQLAHEKSPVGSPHDLTAVNSTDQTTQTSGIENGITERLETHGGKAAVQEIIGHQDLEAVLINKKNAENSTYGTDDTIV